MSNGSRLAIDRHANLFTSRADLAEQLEKSRILVQLASDQILHADPDADYVVRRGKLRVSQFLEDGREITRAVLQAGAVFTTATDGGRDADPADDVYILRDMVLMALGEAELWLLPAGATRP